MDYYIKKQISPFSNIDNPDKQKEIKNKPIETEKKNQ